jgi:hypothetical protein
MLNKKIFILISLLLLIIPILSGCMQGTETISVEYLPGFKAQDMFDDYKPTIAVNSFWDERNITDRVGDGFNSYGGKIESWVTDKNPTKVIEEAIIEQLKNAGFEVKKTSGWNLEADNISSYLKSDFILGGRLKTFWVESRPGFATVSVNSKVTFDLIIADVEKEEIIWAGQFSGSDQKEALIRTKETMRESLSRALTNSVNNVFQNDDVRQAMINIVEIKF